VFTMRVDFWRRNNRRRKCKN